MYREGKYYEQYNKKISASVIAMFMCSTCIASVSAEAPAFIQGKWNYVNSSEQ